MKKRIALFLTSAMLISSFAGAVTVNAEEEKDYSD